MKNKLLHRFLKLLPLCFLLLLAVARGMAQNHAVSHRISVKIANCSDSIFYLNHFTTDGVNNDDTAVCTRDGKLVFAGADSLEPGLYFVSTAKRFRVFDFFITGNAFLSFDFDAGHVVKTMKTSGSAENQQYYKLLAGILTVQMPGSPACADSVACIMAHAALSDPIVESLLTKPNSKLSLSEKYLKACIPPRVLMPETGPKLAASVPDQTTFYIDHFFDNLDLTDPLLATTPVFTDRINEFADTLTALQHIPMQPSIDQLLYLAAANPQNQAYVAWLLMTRFETYYFLPGYDALYIHLVKDYLQTGRIAWFYPEIKARELVQVHKMEPLLNGKTAPDLQMPDTSGIYHHLYDVKSSYTLLLFWASSCSHCRDEMPGFLKFYAQFHQKYNLEIMGVSTDTSAVRWKVYVHRHQLPWINVYGRKSIGGNYHDLYNVQITPTLFLLDDKKTILAKYLTIAQFADLIKSRENR